MEKLAASSTPPQASDSLSDNIVVAKLSAIAILAVASSLAGYIPIKLNDWFRKKGDTPSTFDKVMSFFLNFGGGVLICTVFLHLLPEIREGVDDLEKDNIIHQYVLSYPELIMCIGFFMMFFVEETVHSFLLRGEKVIDCKAPANDAFFEAAIKPTKDTEVVQMKKCDIGPIHTNGTESKCFKNECSKNYHSCENRCHHHVESVIQVEDHGSHSHLPDLNHPSVNSFLTVLALSVHEIFEGLAVGLEKKPEMVWYMLAAVSCHKVVLAAFIGVQLITSNVKKFLANSYIIFFAVTSPMGIFIGLLMTENSQKSDTMTIISVVLQAIATGTLLYIVFFEVFRKQFGDYKASGLMRLFASVCGFIFMICVQILLKDEDKDED